MQGFALLFVLAFAAIAIALSMGWRRAKSVGVIERWASTNGYTLVDWQQEYFRRGPFFLRMRREHTLFYVTLRDGKGHTTQAWIRCSVSLLGVSKHVDVEWDQ